MTLSISLILFLMRKALFFSLVLNSWQRKIKIPYHFHKIDFSFTKYLEYFNEVRLYFCLNTFSFIRKMQGKKKKPNYRIQ